MSGSRSKQVRKAIRHKLEDIGMDEAGLRAKLEERLEEQLADRVRIATELASVALVNHFHREMMTGRPWYVPKRTWTILTHDLFNLTP